MRLSVRTLAELIALAAIAVGLWDLHRSSRPPEPLLRALKHGDEGEKVAALRGLSLLGDDGPPVVPELIAAARDDPSPAVRRGAIFAMMRIALVEPPDEHPIDEALAVPPPPTPPGQPPAPPPRPPQSAKMLRPRAGEVATVIADRMRTDPDPSVRAFAIRALRKILSTAIQERWSARAALKPGQPPPQFEGTGPWVESTFRAIADRAAEDPDPEVVSQAIGALTSSRPVQELLTDPGRAELYLRLIGVDSEDPALPPHLEVLLLSRLVRLVYPGEEAFDPLIDRLVRRVADPPTAGLPELTWERDLIETVRVAYASLLWQVAPSPELFDEHPEVGRVLIDLIADSERYGHSSGANNQFEEWVRRPTADRLRVDLYGGSRGASWEGGGMSLPDLRDAALSAFARDARFLDVLWPRMDRHSRLGWLGGHWSFGPSGEWSGLAPLLDAPEVRAELPPDEAEALLSRLLDEPGPTPEEDGEQSLRPTIREIEDERQGPGRGRAQLQAQGRDGPAFDATPLEAARLRRSIRNLAILAYFARATDPGSDAVSRLVDRLVPLLGAADVPTRTRAATLLGSLGPAASPARPALELMAMGDPDESSREAARYALDQLDPAPEGDPPPDVPRPPTFPTSSEPEPDPSPPEPLP
ncbi:hypothetical protein [Tautonia plasticadhaerens]|uniref:HEAT repeat protein n=1 Tax=Tautonia plasticadhaerens TaxID=2527974 RepID=A0A518HBW6_9BACT|nr:hypothetical protein [Tautonia plasticadhaerens]QDV38354.1 HEAT repeat protein [Tautonia plasticadhaerens]